ncbi:MAG TPA: hypothetical protein VF440_00240 [Novosphingobium sp.]
MPSMLSLKVIGMAGLASYAVAYVCARRRHVAYHRYKLIRIAAADLPDMPRGYSARVLSPAELARHTIDVGPDAQAERFRAGLACLGTFDRAGALVGVAWMARAAHREHDLHVRYVLPDNAAWDTGMWIPEDKRMGRAFAAVCAAIKQWLREQGLDCSMSSIADYNVSSILAHRRLGSVRMRYVTVLRIGRFQFTLGARPRFCVVGRTPMPAVTLP